MDNKEFEKKLEQIKTFKEVPISVDEKIQKAFENIEENEKLEKEVKKQKSKFNFSRVLSLAASFVMAIFLAGNGVAYAKGEPNIYSWILERIGMPSGYQDIKTDINQIVEEDDVKITLIDGGLSNNSFELVYMIESEGLFEYDEVIFDSIIEVSANKEVYKEGYTDMLYEYSTSESIISNNKAVIHRSYAIAGNNLEGKQIDLNIKISRVGSFKSDIGFDEKGQPIQYKDKSENIWEFDVENFESKKLQYESYVVVSQKKIDDRLTINSLSIEDSALYSNVFCDLYAQGYKEEHTEYCMQILDTKGNIIFESGLCMMEEGYNNINGRTLERIKIEQEYIVNIYESNYYIENEEMETILIDTFNINLNEHNKAKERFFIGTEFYINENCKIDSIIIENFERFGRVKVLSNLPDYNTDLIKDDEYYFLVRIENLKGEIIGEINQYGNNYSYNHFTITEKFDESDIYTLKLYKYKYIAYDGKYELWHIDTYQSEEDLILISEYNFTLK